MNEIRQLLDSLKSIFLLLCGRVCAKVLSFLFILFVSQEFGVVSVGQIALLYTLASGAAIIAGCGIPTYFLKSMAIADDKRYVFISGNYSVITLSLILGGVCISILLAGGLYYLDPETLSTVFCALVLFIPYGLVQLNLSALRALAKDWSVVIVDLTVSALPIIFLFLVIRLFNNPYQFDVKYTIIAAYVITLGLSLHIVLRHLQFKLKTSINAKNIYSPIVKARSFFLVTFSMFLNGYISIFIIYSLLGSEQLGVFYIVNSLTGICLIILTVVNSWIAPQFAKAYQDNDIQYLGILSRKANSLALVLALPIFLILVLFAEEILNMYGIYSENTHKVLVSMVLFQAINLYLCSSGYLLAMSGNEKFYAKLIVLSAVIDGVSSFVLIPYLGLLGAAIGGGLALGFWNAACFIKCKKVFGFSPSWYPGHQGI